MDNKIRKISFLFPSAESEKKGKNEDFQLVSIM